MSDYESDEENIDFHLEPKGYLYEPEYTDDELRQMELDRAERERVDREVMEAEAGASAGAAISRVADKSWCTCFKCELMQTGGCYCCHEWDLVMPEIQNLSIDEDVGVAAAAVCITNNSDFPALLKVELAL